MKNRLKHAFSCLLIGIFLITIVPELQAQLGLGRVTGLDFYQRHRIPNYNGHHGHSTGSAMANIVLGPKVWVGGRLFSVSVEGAVSYAPFAFDVGDSKGLGALSFPISVDLNYGGLSGFSVQSKYGFSLGAGVSFHRTELYFVKDEYTETREEGFYRVYFGQAAVGVGSGGSDLRLYARYGKGVRSSSFFSIGILSSVNYFTGKTVPLGN